VNEFTCVQNYFYWISSNLLLIKGNKVWLVINQTCCGIIHKLRVLMVHEIQYMLCSTMVYKDQNLKGLVNIILTRDMTCQTLDVPAM